MMGWSQESLLRRYQHVDDAMLQQAADRVGNILFGNG